MVEAASDHLLSFPEIVPVQTVLGGGEEEEGCEVIVVLTRPMDTVTGIGLGLSAWWV
mgnify:CR=1 FL=1